MESPQAIPAAPHSARMPAVDGLLPSTAGASAKQASELLLTVLREHEPGLVDHVASVGRRARAIAIQMGCPMRDITMISRAAELHDVGKIAIPLTVLRKRSPFNADEWRTMQEHTLVGQRILDSIPSLRRIGVLVRSSHERWDGAGYPDGLAGEEIPLGSRIIFVADAFDAMTEHRSYQRALTPGQAVEEVRRCAGSQFDPRVVDAFLSTTSPAATARAWT